MPFKMAFNQIVRLIRCLSKQIFRSSFIFIGWKQFEGTLHWPDSRKAEGDIVSKINICSFHKRMRLIFLVYDVRIYAGKMYLFAFSFALICWHEQFVTKTKQISFFLSKNPIGIHCREFFLSKYWFFRLKLFIHNFVRTTSNDFTAHFRLFC